MIVHLGPKAEQGLREAGFNIPMRPEVGAVTFNGSVVGRVDNFTGLVIEDDQKEAVTLVLSLEKELKLGCWNVPVYN